MLSFSLNNRISASKEFKEVFRGEIKLRLPFLVFFAKKNNLGYARLGTNVGKKYVKSAVKRNLLKRIVRETFRLNQNNLSGLDIVVIIRGFPTGSPQDSRKAFHEILEKQWKKLSLIYQKKLLS